jgi:hypothetical protein
MFLLLFIFSTVWAGNTFTYNVTSNNEDRALLALQSNAFSALYGSLALNETFPNIVYYGVGLDAGVLSIRLNAFMENSSAKKNRVIMNATITPELLIEYDSNGEPTDNQIRFSDTSTGWSPIGTGILSLSNTTLIPPSLLNENATIISTLWTGPQQNSLGQNLTALFNIFIAPSIEDMGRMFMNGTLGQLNQNTTGLITAVSVSNFPFKSNGTLVLRNIVKINETIYTVREPVAVNINKTVPYLAFNDSIITSDTVVDRKILNLVRNFSRTQFDRVIVIGGQFDGAINKTMLLEGMAVNLAEIQSVLPMGNSGSRLAISPLAILLPYTLSLLLFL